MAERERDALERAVAVVTAEHETLVAARGAALSDSSARANLFLGAVSSSLVALAFVSQAQRLGGIVAAFSFVLLPTLVFLGFITFARALEDAGKDALYLRAINRLRRYYVDVFPHALPYFTFAIDDGNGIELTSSGGLRWERRLTTHTAVGTINAAIAGALVGLAAAIACAAPLAVAFAIGLAGTALMLIFNAWYETRYWKTFEARLTQRYAERTAPTNQGEL